MDCGKAWTEPCFNIDGEQSVNALPCPPSRLIPRRPQWHREQHAHQIRLPVGLCFPEEVLQMEDDRGLCYFELFGNLIETLAVDEHQRHARLGGSEVIEPHERVAGHL